MLDTELMKLGEKGVVQGTKLEADKFFHVDVLPPGKPAHLEPLLVEGARPREVYLVYTKFGEDPPPIMIKVSTDAGRTWGEERPLTDAGGKKITGFHTSIVRMRSGKLGMIYSTQYPGVGHPGRESGTLVTFRTSADGGKTWSEPAIVDDNFACCTTGHMVALSTGRVVAPAFRWVSPIPTNDAEGWVLSSNEPSPTLSYSFAFVSDDEGKTWRKSLSELFVSVRRAAFDLEEPTVVELKDGKLLAHLRSEVGRIYRSYSPDGGLSWTRPEGLPIAASYTPQILKRLPGTGELLMVWNQISRQEIVTCLHRHRLSCAISRDEGKTWENFKNLESLDDVTVVTPPPMGETMALQPYESYGYRQPQPGLWRYHRAPGILRICYPTVAFARDEALVAYDIGEGSLGNGVHGARLRAIPVGWFTE
ncbi:MAG: sialidase family protein [Planctomycetota bacterium]